jgi:K+/H+ antiporter YhaU regulatory subunit KhtT
MRLIAVSIALLLLAGCANTGGGGMQNTAGGSIPRPKSVLVSDFVFSSDVVAVDRGFTSRLERKIGGFPTHERKQRTAERVNDEIIATVIATVREAGLEARPGNEDGLSLSDDVVVITGRLRPSDPAVAAAKKDQIGFGAGRGGVTADMSLSHFSSSGKRQLTSFATEGQKERKGATNVKLVAAQNNAIASALAAANAAKEKLSPDVEAQARRLGRAIGEKILALAKEQGWLEKPESVEAAPEEKPARAPSVSSEKKSEKPET